MDIQALARTLSAESSPRQRFPELGRLRIAPADVAGALLTQPQQGGTNSFSRQEMVTLNTLARDRKKFANRLRRLARDIRTQIFPTFCKPMFEDWISPAAPSFKRIPDDLCALAGCLSLPPKDSQRSRDIASYMAAIAEGNRKDRAKLRGKPKEQGLRDLRIITLVNLFKRACGKPQFALVARLMELVGCCLDADAVKHAYYQNWCAPFLDENGFLRVPGRRTVRTKNGSLRIPGRTGCWINGRRVG